MKRNLSLLFICLTLYSCDIFSFAILVNNTNEDIKIKIQYDRENFGKGLKKNQIVTQLKSLPNYCGGGGTTIILDTLNLITEIKLKPKDSLFIDMNRGSNINFKMIKNLTVYGHDTINLNSKVKLENLFKPTETNIYIMDVK